MGLDGSRRGEGGRTGVKKVCVRCFGGLGLVRMCVIVFGRVWVCAGGGVVGWWSCILSVCEGMVIGVCDLEDWY